MFQPEEIEHHDFAVTFRGFDPKEVRSFLASIAADQRTRADRLDEQEAEDPHELLDEAKHLAAAVVEEAERRAGVVEDAARARAAAIETDAERRTAEAIAPASPAGDLGEQIAAVLTTANHEAESTVTAARAEADRIVARARADAERIRRDAAPEREAVLLATDGRGHGFNDTALFAPSDRARSSNGPASNGQDRSAVATEAIRAIVQLVLEGDHGHRAPADPGVAAARALPSTRSEGGADPALASSLPASRPIDPRVERISTDLEVELRSRFADDHGPIDGIGREVPAPPLLEPPAETEHQPPVVDVTDATLHGHREAGDAPFWAIDGSSPHPTPPPSDPDWTQQ